MEGDMTVPTQRKNQNVGSEPEFNTLDEPVRVTVVSVISQVSRFINKNYDTFYAWYYKCYFFSCGILELLE